MIVAPSSQYTIPTASSHENNNLVDVTTTHLSLHLLPTPLVKSHAAKSRAHDPLPLRLPSQSPHLLQRILPRSERRLQLPQTLPESIPVHRIVNFDTRSELPGCRTDDFEVAIVFENDELSVAKCDGDGGGGYAGRRGGYDVGICWRVDVESLVAAAFGVWWWRVL